MFEAITAGALSGMILGSLPGGVVFSVLQHSIDLGWRKGMGIALGVLLSDFCLILFVNLSTSGLALIEEYDGYISMAGILLLVILGFVNLFSQKKSIIYPTTKMGGGFYLITIGFLLNTLNPVNFFMWMTITTQIQTSSFFSHQNLLVYFAATLLMIFSTLTVISYFAQKLRRWLNPERMHYFNMGIGIIFIILAIKLGYTAYLKHFVN